MTVTPETHARQGWSWHNDLLHLLAQPIVAGQGAYREGQTVGIQVIPRRHPDQAIVDVFVTLFLLRLPPPGEDDMAADQAALAAFLEGLRDPDVHIRAAACEALGQLGDTAARAALQAACQDADRTVRAVATQALAALDTTRLPVSDLVGVRLLLWQQVRHLWKPFAHQATDRRGQTRFTDVPTNAVCQLQLLGAQPRGRVTLAGQSRQPQVQALAARSATAPAASLPQSQTLALADGQLLGTLYRNPRGQVVLEFRSDAPHLQGGLIHVSATSQREQADVVSHFVPLESDARGMLTGRFILSEALDLAQAYDLTFEPVPAPGARM